jgi:Ran GTPase-activating protein (RanGAP) involved in mRNA processing and transport
VIDDSIPLQKLRLLVDSLTKVIMVRRRYIRDYVEELNLNGKETGDKGAQVLTEELTTNTTLKKVYLWNNKIGDDGAVALATALTTNTTLEELCLGNNRIGNNGSVALAASFVKNKTLKILSLPWNEIAQCWPGLGAE